MSSDKRNCVDVTAVIRLGLMGRAAKTEKSRWVGVRAKPQIFKLLNAGSSKLEPDEAREIEQSVALAWCRSEEALTIRILGDKTSDEIGADFVIGLPNHRTERGADSAAFGAQLLHRRDSGLDNAG